MTVTGRSAAEERLLDAELEQLLRATPTDRALDRTGAAPPPRARWLVAATIAFGVTVGTLTLVLREPAPTATARPDVLPQDPTPSRPPIPRAVHAKWGQLRDVDDDVVHLVCRLVAPADIAQLTRFTALRRLSILAVGMDFAALDTVRGWSKAPDDALRPLLQLSHLEELQLPSQFALRPAHLAPLAAAPALRRLDLTRAAGAVTPELARALAGLPHLECLYFDLAPIDATALERLLPLQLRELELSRCPQLDAAAWAVLPRMQHLRRLRLSGLGEPAFDAPHEVSWRPDAAAVRGLRALPALEHLTFQGCRLDDDVLAALPERLEVLELLAVAGVGPPGLQALRRLGGLREFGYRPSQFGNPFAPAPPVDRIAHMDACADALADAIATLRLRRVTWHCRWTAALARALGQQPDLRRLELFVQADPDLLPLAEARALAEVQLLNTPLDLDDLAPLARVAALRRFELFGGRKLDLAEVGALLGDRVEVTDRLD